ncbi:hypothetical protein ALI144C_00680 [Actinosynnema sp. ALI-1.44]|uniref:hypothetical protein n=1 Tax=Actinosynnema sp. ALI-1.44 TaxID=1933779 RepID=UPI00097C1FF6|nr:hypothetical protein [Actinosynnema sp. ALI-1.44]ONI91787.1 hypothetical protein ALI144C_00680 [Actinosynnema sp. ALI-1.44]
MTRSRLFRRAAVVAVAGATAMGLASLSQNASAETEVPVFDFADCPRIPAGADPAKWRCEVLMSSGTIELGGLAEQPLGAMRMVFAEGQSDGKYAQVFGSLQAEPTRVLGGLLGIPGSDDRNPLLRLDVRIEYAGFADFLSVGDQMGEQHLKLRVISPLLPSTCTIGDDKDPIKLRPTRTSGPDVVSTNPPVARFTMADKQFAVPRARGCNGLDRLLDKRFGLPAASGTNLLKMTTLVQMKYYNQLPTG